MDVFRGRARDAWFIGATGTTAVTATATASTGSPAELVEAASLEHISGSSDAAATVTISWTDSGGTARTWTKKFAAAFSFSETFPPGMIVASGGGSITCVISAGSASCQLNIGGVYY
jgi:hypothetical protein